MSEKAEIVKALKKESIRAWYMRKTRGARRALIWATVITVIAMGLMWAFASIQVLSRLQTFNGALSVPSLGGIWIFSFIFMFLIPSREASFRGQESLEEGVDLVRGAIKEQLAPAMELWTRIGKKLEAELPGIVQKVHATLDDLRVQAKKIEKAVAKNEEITEDLKPVIEALKRIEGKVETELATGLIEDVRRAANTVEGVGGALGGSVPKGNGRATPKDDEPDLHWVVKAIGNWRQKPGGERRS